MVPLARARALDTIEDIEGELDFLPKNGESRRKLLTEEKTRFGL